MIEHYQSVVKNTNNFPFNFGTTPKGQPIAYCTAFPLLADASVEGEVGGKGARYARNSESR